MLNLIQFITGFLGIVLLLGSIPASISDPEVPPFANPNAVFHMSQTAIDVLDNLPIQKSEEERKKKFEEGFFENIKSLSINSKVACTTATKDKSCTPISGLDKDTDFYNIIITVKKIEQNGIDKRIVAKNNKDKLEHVLLKHHGITDYYRAQSLSFITANVPISEISRLADHDFVGGIGDGQRKIGTLSLNMDDAKISVNADNLGVTGEGVIVSVIDTGIKQNPAHPDLPIPSKIIKKIRCTGSICDPNGDTEDGDHGTAQAGIIGGLGTAQANMKGIAPDSLLYVVKTTTDSDGSSIATSLDWSLTNGADIANVSLSVGNCLSYEMIAVIIDEAIDEGLLVIVGAGNSGPSSETIKGLGCSLNTIAVGGFDDQNSPQTTDDVVSTNSSRGPTFDDRLKPEILAPSENVYSHSGLQGTNYDFRDGTSHATPFVSGAAALLLEQNSYYRPLEIKAALLLGADWKGTVFPITAQTYDFGSDNTALNANGFGFLNIENSLNYANSGTNILFDTFEVGSPSTKEYSFSANKNEQVKIILSWITHPTGTIPDPTATTISNLDLTIKNSNDQEIIFSRSTIQNNEFLIFDAPEEGLHTYTIEVNLVSLESVNQDPWVLASSKSLTAPCPSFPPSGIWTIDKTCFISGTVAVPTNLDVRVLNVSDLVVLEDATLDINFDNKKLEIISGSRVIVKENGKIT